MEPAKPKLQLAPTTPNIVSNSNYFTERRNRSCRPNFAVMTPSNMDNIKIIDKSLNSTKIQKLFSKFGTMKKEGLNYDSGNPER